MNLHKEKGAQNIFTNTVIGFILWLSQPMDYIPCPVFLKKKLTNDEQLSHLIVQKK